MNQTVTSACTSINKTRMPAIYGKLMIRFVDRVLDYGCGRYTEHLYNHCKERNAKFFPIDPFNQPDWKNKLSHDMLEKYPATIGIMSNVLNVIDSDEAIKEAVENALSLVSSKYFLYITVYEGDKSGIGRYTGKDSYQRNMRLKDYIPMLRKMGFDAFVDHGTIMIQGKHA